ncbi:hypothetical protein ANO11243_066500 [Dothideomycetidae sp. 11243]|nr:hypothetical protein ANO11243_066500 [fungal sp. No.11243]
MVDKQEQRPLSPTTTAAPQTEPGAGPHTSEAPLPPPPPADPDTAPLPPSASSPPAAAETSPPTVQQSADTIRWIQDLRDGLDAFYRLPDQRGKTRLQVALAYEAALRREQLEAMIYGREVNVVGSIYKWLEEYIEFLRERE